MIKTHSRLMIDADRTVITVQNTSVRFQATVDPESPVELFLGPQFGRLMFRHEIEQLRTALTNLLDTGTFR